MPKNPNIKKVLVIGSGPIVIGQAAEFDYAGTQACRSLKEEGMEVVLLNSNPATIMTDKDIADRVYIEPLFQIPYAVITATEVNRLHLHIRKFVSKFHHFNQCGTFFLRQFRRCFRVKHT